MTWQDSAACADMNPELFFKGTGKQYLTGRETNRQPTRFAEAIAVCATCPVQTDCLAYAMDFESGQPAQYVHGVWGGLTPAQRHPTPARIRRPAVRRAA